MKVLFTLVGALLGAWYLGSASAGSAFGGMVFGGCVGFLLSAVVELRERVRQLEQRSVLPVSAALDVASPPVEPEPAESLPAVSEPATTLAQDRTAEEVWPESTAANTVPKTRVEQTLIEALQYLRNFFTGEHAIPRIGAVVLFFGVAFLLKYAAERSLLPIELRLFGAIAAAIVLLVFGWRLRARRTGYALVLQGAGVGVLYLTVFAALRLYGLLPATGAFVVLVLICAFSGALAVLQNARSLAVVGAAGGFLAPILVSTGAGNHVVLFSYYALLNAGILGIAWFRAWRELNLLGFLFTFVIGVAWGVQRYRPELFMSTEPFLVLFFLFYVVVAVLFALRQPPQLRGYVDGTIVFGVPVVAFALQAAVVRDFAYGLAWSAAGAGALYIGLASLLWRLRPQALRLLCEAFLALGVVFATLALPLALDGRWTSAAWALEGAAIVWIGVHQRRLSARAFGSLLLLGAGLMFLGDLGRESIGWPVLNSLYLGTLMIALAALFAAHELNRTRTQLHAWEQGVAAALFGWGLLWWFIGGLREIEVQLQDSSVRLDAVVGFAVLSGGLAEVLGARLNWKWLRLVTLGLLPAGLLLAASSLTIKSHPLTPTGVIVWTAFLAGHLMLLRRGEDWLEHRYLDFHHGATAWLVALLGAQELHWVGARIASGEAWSIVGWGIAPALAAVAAGSLRLGAPWSNYRHAYITIGAAPLLGVACLWLLAANLASRGDPTPLPYLPLLNPIDLVSLLVLLAVAHRLTQSRALLGEDNARVAVAAGAALAFVWLNAALLRALHHLGGVTFTWRAMMDSVLVQTSLSIFWTMLALAVMVLATRRGWRPPWMTGAGLLAMVVVKLFVVDLDRTGTLERVVSFMVVGALLLLIGYLAPIPPSQKHADAAS